VKQEVFRPGRDVAAARVGDIHPQVEGAARALIADASPIEQCWWSPVMAATAAYWSGIPTQLIEASCTVRMIGASPGGVTR